LWGAVRAFRRAGEPDFAPAETDLLERATANVVAALRRELLRTEIREKPVNDSGPGLVLLDESLHSRSVTTAAQRWLDEIEDGVDGSRELPYTLLTLAGRAHCTSQATRSRIRTRSGRWISHP
jgi:hypothetical protein